MSTGKAEHRRERIAEASDGVITLANMMLRLGHDLKRLLAEEGVTAPPFDTDSPKPPPSGC